MKKILALTGLVVLASLLFFNVSISVNEDTKGSVSLDLLATTAIAQSEGGGGTISPPRYGWFSSSQGFICNCYTAGSACRCIY